MPKSKLNYQDLFDQIHFVIKARQDNDMVDGTSAVYIKNETKLPLTD